MRRLALPVLGLLLASCGGHGGSASSTSADTKTIDVGKGKGRATMQVRWPERGARLIPNAANSIVVSLAQGGVTVATATITRPASGATTTTTSFTGLAYGDYTTTVLAYPGTNGDGGAAQAQGTGTLTVSEDVPGTLAVSLASTVDHLVVSPATYSIGPGGTKSLTASAVDASGALVLLSAGGGTEGLTWTSDSAAATVAGTGPTATLKGVAVGTATVTATLKKDDAGSVATGTAAATVLAGTVTVSPARASFTYTRHGTSYTVSPTSVTFHRNAEPPAPGLGGDVDQRSTLLSATLATRVEIQLGLRLGVEGRRDLSR